LSVADPWALSLCEAADAVRSGRIKAEALAEACLDRIGQAGHLNCVVAADRNAALESARATDRAIAQGRDPGVLGGVPLAHKDMFYRKGRVTECGSLIRRDFVPDVTAAVLERLDRAGAVDLARLHMAEFAMGPSGHNAHLGRCRNPWNPDHITGGSSSGSGSAVAARLAFGALGSDTGGSVRLPAAMCGVVGLKPTQGRVSRYGSMPLSDSLDCIGPLARTVRDVARLMGVLAGADPRDPGTVATPVPDYEAALDGTSAGRLDGVRIGLPTSFYFDGLDPEVAELVDAARRKLESLGASVVDVDIPDHRQLGELAGVVFTPEAATLHLPWLRERPGDYGEQVRARLLQGLTLPATAYLQARTLRGRMLADMVEGPLRHCDALLTPVLKHRVPTGAETDVGAGAGMAKVVGGLAELTRPLSYLGLPGLSVPAGFTANGLPTAIQLIGKPFSEGELLSIGHAYELASGWTREAPSLRSRT
jgi:aspartyl-tRNA(Asn)/glutamyl-tRNA(Gln) amidotransferase subunit A